MQDRLGTLGSIASIIGLALGLILFFEQSTTFPRVAAMLSAVVSPPLLEFLVTVLIFTVLLICLWRQNMLRKQIEAYRGEDQGHPAPTPKQEQEKLRLLPGWEIRLQPPVLTAIPSSLTGSQAAWLIAHIRTSSGDVQLKIFAAPTHMEFAKQLVEVFHTAGHSLIIDEGRNEPVFIAQSIHNKIVLRYNENGASTRVGACIRLSEVLIQVFGTLVDLDPFPRGSTAKHFQIEIGGGP